MNRRGADSPLRAIAAVASLGALLVGLATTLVNVAVGDIARQLDTSLSAAQWVLSAYLLALAVVIPISSWAMHRFGARRVWLVAMGLFLGGSALSAAAWSIESLIAFRVVQGVGGGLIVPVGQTLVVTAAGTRRLGRVMSALNLPLVAGPALGPALGGLLVDAFGWRALLIVNLLPGLAAIVIGLRVLPRVAGSRDTRLDGTGFVLLVTGMLALLAGISAVGGDRTSAAVAVTATGLLLLAGFGWHSAHRSRSPLLDLGLLRGRAYATAAVVAFGFQFIHAGALVIMALYLQVVRGESPLATGAFVAVQGCGTLCALLLVGRYADRFGAARMAKGGLALALLTTLPWALVGPATPYWSLLPATFLRGVGLSSTMTPVYAFAYERVPRASMPSASAMLNSLSRLGAAAGVAVLVLVLGVGTAGSSAFATTFAVVAAVNAVVLVVALTLSSRAVAQ